MPVVLPGTAQQKRAHVKPPRNAADAQARGGDPRLSSTRVHIRANAYARARVSDVREFAAALAGMRREAANGTPWEQTLRKYDEPWEVDDEARLRQAMSRDDAPGPRSPRSYSELRSHYEMIGLWYRHVDRLYD